MNKTNKLLIIIDMQPRWKLSDDSLIAKIAAFAYTWQKTDPVLLVEFGKYSPTHKVIRKLVPYADIVYKNDTDGSVDISQWLDSNQYDNCELYLCGCYTGQCVAETLYGLINMGYDARLIFELCQQYQEVADLQTDGHNQYNSRSRPQQLHFFKKAKVDIVDPVLALS